MADMLNLPIDDVIHLYDIKHLPARDIARRFETSVPTILKKLRQNGITIRDSNRNEFRMDSVTSSNLHPNIKTIIKINGKRYGSAICPDCGETRTVPLLSASSKSPFTGRCHKCYEASINPPSIDLIKPLYVNENLTIKQIAKQLHTSHATVTRRLREHNIPIKLGAKPRAYDGTGRTCIICGQHKPLSEFFKWRGAPGSYCKECHNMKSSEEYSKRIDLPPDELYKLRVANSKLQVQRNYRLKLEVLSHYSNLNHPQCLNPYNIHPEVITDPDILSLDHIDGNGHNERSASGRRIGSCNLYRKLKRRDYPSGYQVLCGNCQLKKVAVNKEHPRKYNHEATS